MAAPQRNWRGPTGSPGGVPGAVPNSGLPNQPTQSTGSQSLLGSGNAGSQDLHWWDRNPVVRTLAAEAARQTALPLGALRGVGHTAEGLLGGAEFIGRLTNPLDVLLSPPGEAAQDKVVDAAKGVVDYFKTSTPSKIASDVGDHVHRFIASVDPTATPPAPTLAGEVVRNAKIGMNQGELAFDIGSTLYGGAEAKALDALGRAAEAVTPAKYLAQGYTPELANYFATPYKGMGHHFLPQRIIDDLPPSLQGIGRAISESPFFLLKPDGMSTGDFYQLHYRVDPSYYGGKMGKEFGGSRWSGKKLGWQKYGLLGQIVNGSPTPLKAAAAIGSLDAASNVEFNDAQPDEPDQVDESDQPDQPDWTQP